MKIWTVQHKSVLEELNRKGVFLADFNRSYFVKQNPQRKELYDFLLTSFNRVNRLDVDGLIFGFFGLDETGRSIISFDTINEFKIALSKNKLAVYSLWETFKARGDCVILELEYHNLGENYNPIFIDINDFQQLMPPVAYNVLYTESVTRGIVDNVSRGICRPSVLPSCIIQGHVPGISGIYNLKRVYNFFDL